MENFCHHIENLLVQHDYVVVPNLGGFVVQKQSAQLLHNRITPPTSVISFNPLMQYADGLLAIEISRSEQISYRQAVEVIDNSVVQLWSDLRENGRVQLGDLGKLIYGGMNNLTFLPSMKASFLPQNFELNELYVSTIVSRQQNDERKKLTISLPSSKFYKFATAAAIIAGLLFISPKVADVRQAEYASLSSLSFVDTISDSVAGKTDANSLNEKVNLEVSTPVEKKINEKSLPSTENEFHVVVASLPTQESADKYCKELIGANFSDAKVLPPKKTYRVAIQSFSNKDEAIKYMENLRKTDTRFETAWVLCK
ncbi:MAG: SPOR domain-containing protein [Paludibacter sp.]|nr:SPOR domain-containing protein [Paludibacter sp.]